MKKSLTFILAIAAGSLFAQQNSTFNSAASTAQEKLEAALSELNEIQEEIADVRPELGAKLDDVETKALQLRDEASTAARVKSTFDVEVSQLEKTKQNVIENNSYLQSTLLNEYIRRFDLTIDPSEIPMYQEQINDTLALLESEEAVDDATIFQAQLEIIELSLERLERVISGSTFSGNASIDGEIEDGSFALLGPVSYFASDNGRAGITRGMIENRADIYELPEFASMISSTISSKSGNLPIDTTDGEALETRTHDISLTDEIKLGGLVMWPILSLFGISILIALFKTVELFRVKAAKSKDIDAILEMLNKGQNDQAMAYAKKVGGPVGEMLCAAVENADEDREVIEEVLYETIIKTQPKLERFLSFIAVVAATAPLLGLLGTVTGMIKTFKLITIVGTGDARNLSSGISEALITTKWGLIVAIPTLIIHALLNRKAKGVIGSMEQAAVSFLNGLGEMNQDKSSES